MLVLVVDRRRAGCSSGALFFGRPLVAESTVPVGESAPVEIRNWTAAAAAAALAAFLDRCGLVRLPNGVGHSGRRTSHVNVVGVGV